MCRNQRSHSKFLALASAKQVFSTLQGWPSNYGICLIYDMMCVCVCVACVSKEEIRQTLVQKNSCHCLDMTL